MSALKKRTLFALVALFSILPILSSCFNNDDGDNDNPSGYFFSMNFDGESVLAENISVSHNSSFGFNTCSYVKSRLTPFFDSSLGLVVDLELRVSDDTVTRSGLESLVGKELPLYPICSISDTSDWKCRFRVYVNTFKEYRASSESNEMNYLKVKKIEFIETEDIGFNLVRDRFLVEGSIDYALLKDIDGYAPDIEMHSLEFRTMFPIKRPE